MTALLLAAALVFQHEPKQPKPTLEVGHNVWVLGSDTWDREVKHDWGEVIGFCGDKVIVDGQLFEWEAPIHSVRRTGDK